MRLLADEVVKTKTLGNSAVSIPKSLYAGKILGKEIEIDTCIPSADFGSSLIESLQHQHPVINTWLLLSSISICFLSAIFFVIPQ